MKAFEMIIEDREHVFKCVRPARNVNELKKIYGGNGDFVRIKDVTQTLYARAQELCAANYSMKLTLRRRFDSWHNKRYYDITVVKIINAPNTRPLVILSEEYKGTERHTALKRFEELKKQYPNIETEKDIEKSKWER